MASEKQVNILMQLLDEALSEVDTIEGKLSSYEEMLQSVKDQMDQISQSNHLIQISNTNNSKLLDEIQFLVVRHLKVPVTSNFNSSFSSVYLYSFMSQQTSSQVSEQKQSI